MCPLMAGMILLVVLHRTSNHKGLVAAVLGVAIGIQAIVGNAGLAVVPVLLWQVYSQYPAKSSAVYHAGIVVAAILLGAGPWMARNNALLGHPVLNTNFGFNLYIGNNANATGYFLNIADTPIGSEEFNEKLLAEGEYETYAYLAREAKQYMLENPARTADLFLRKALLFWAPPGAGGIYNAAETVARWANYVQHWVLVGLFGVFSVWVIRRHRSLLFLPATVVLYAAAHMPFYVSSRYRLSIMPVLCLGGGLVLNWLWALISAKRPIRRISW